MSHYEIEEAIYAENYAKRVTNEKSIRIVRGTLVHFDYPRKKVVVLSNRSLRVPDGFVGVWFYGTIGEGSASWETSKLRLSHEPPIGLIAHEISHLLLVQEHGFKFHPHGKEFDGWNAKVQGWCKRYLKGD
jgi:hypothetical protein